MKEAMRKVSNSEIEQWATAPTWKVILWAVMMIVAFGVLWVREKLTNN